MTKKKGINREQLERVAVPEENTAPASPVSGDRESLIRRARAYLLTVDPAISGQKGHNQTWKVACILVVDFDLSIDEARPLMEEFSARCYPPWSAKDIEHKLKGAAKKPGPRGKLANVQLQDPSTNGRHEKRDDKPPPLDAAPPILPGSQELAPFPIDAVFPEILARYAREVASTIQCPVDYVGVPMLAIAGAAIGASRSLCLKRGIWYESPRLYVVVVAPPGSAKTPALNAVAKPLHAAHTRMEAEHQEALAAFERDLEDYEAARKSSRDDPTIASPVKPQKPRFLRRVTSDFTTESLAPILSENPRGMAVVRDELSAWVSSMNQYKGGKGSDRQFFLSSWSGEPVIVDRKNQNLQPITVSHPFLCIVGGIQPDMLSELQDERGREDGFVHRLLFTCPKPILGQRWTSADLSQEAREAWVRSVESLYALRMEEDLEQRNQRPVSVSFTKEALALWIAWHDEHAGEMRDPDFPASLLGPWAKLRSHAARIALILQMMRASCGEAAWDVVDDVSVLAAAAIVSYFKDHLRVVYGQFHTSKEDVLAEELYRWVLAHGGECTARTIIHRRVCGLTKSSDARLALRDLEDRELGQIIRRKATNNHEVDVFVALGSAASAASAPH